MPTDKIRDSLESLKSFCEAEGYMGWDPFDGLNSKVFQSIPGIRNSRLFRLAWIQAFKRNPVNLRKPLLISKGYNSKGLGLFLTGYCNLYQMDPAEEYLQKIRMLSGTILDMVSKGYSGACWGYNFDWQAKAFFQPSGTPTVVASTFIGNALYDAYQITKESALLETAHSVSEFVLRDLNRTYDPEGDFSFSYSPLDRSQVFNATLLGAKMLARTYSYTGKKALLDEASKAVHFCVKHQHEDGSWAYSTLPYHQWIDSFHTGFNLECLAEYQRFTGDLRHHEAIEKGFGFYLEHFVLPDGRCKYYHNSLYPIDIHAPAQFVVTLCKLGKLNACQSTATSILNWVIDHMQDKHGYFYYQVRKSFTNRIPYIRWAQSWMFYALTEYLKNIPQHRVDP